MSLFVRLLRDECGASAAEYAMILAIVGTAITLASLFLGAAVADAINDAGTCMATNGSSCQ